MPIIPAKESIFLYDNIYQAISEPKRIQILYALSEQPLNVTALAQALDTPQPTISRHLAVLRQCSLVLSERIGASVIYRLADLRMITVLDLMHQVLQDALVRKSNVVSEPEAIVK